MHNVRSFSCIFAAMLAILLITTSPTFAQSYDPNDPAQDWDGDGIPNDIDLDDDNDGVLDADDSAPADASIPGTLTETYDPLDPAQDSDNDGIPNDLDLDDDNDGIINANDPQPSGPPDTATEAPLVDPPPAEPSTAQTSVSSVPVVSSLPRTGAGVSLAQVPMLWILTGLVLMGIGSRLVRNPHHC